MTDPQLTAYIQKSVVFLYSYTGLQERQINKTISYTTAKKEKKCQGIILATEGKEVYIANHKHR